MVLGDDDEAGKCPHIVEGKKCSQETADFEEGSQNAGTAPKRAVADREEQVSKDAPDTRFLGLVREGGQADALPEFLQLLLAESECCFESCACYGESCSC